MQLLSSAPPTAAAPDLGAPAPAVSPAPSTVGIPAAGPSPVDTASDRAVDELSDAVGDLIRTWHSAGRRGTEQIGTQVIARALVTLIGEGEHRLTALAERRGVDQSVISRQIGELQAHGLVCRRSDPADRRASLVRLTPAGRQLLAQTGQLRRRWMRDALACTPTVDLQTAVALLTAITAQLQARIADSEPSPSDTDKIVKKGRTAP